MRLNPPVGGFFRRTTKELILDGVVVPAGRVVQVALAASNGYQTDSNGLAVDQDDLEQFKSQRFMGEQIGVCLLPFAGGERVCLGKALAELEIRLMALGLLKPAVVLLLEKLAEDFKGLNLEFSLDNTLLISMRQTDLLDSSVKLSIKQPAVTAELLLEKALQPQITKLLSVADEIGRFSISEFKRN